MLPRSTKFDTPIVPRVSVNVCQCQSSERIDLEQSANQTCEWCHNRQKSTGEKTPPYSERRGPAGSMVAQRRSTQIHMSDIPCCDLWAHPKECLSQEVSHFREGTR
jgi:hypothetical protein